MKYTHKNFGTCSSQTIVDIDDDGIITSVEFIGGCHGNTQGVAALCRGRDAREVAQTLLGIKCGFKKTSCPDQLAKAINEALCK